MNMSDAIFLRLATGPTKSAIKFAIMLIVVCVCCFSIGCVSSGTTKNTGGTSNDRLTSHDTVVVETISEAPNSEQQRKLLHALIASGLQQSGKFKRVAGSVPPEDSAPHFKVTARIKDLSKVSDVARSTLGVLAGRASIVVDVELTDSQRGVSVGTFQAVGKSSAGWVGAGTTDQAVQRAAEQSVAESVKRR